MGTDNFDIATARRNPCQAKTKVGLKAEAHSSSFFLVEAEKHIKQQSLERDSQLQAKTVAQTVG